MTKEEIKENISRMNIEQLRENLYETILQMYEMKEKQDKANEHLKRIVNESKKIKKSLKDAEGDQNEFLN